MNSLMVFLSPPDRPCKIGSCEPCAEKTAGDEEEESFHACRGLVDAELSDAKIYIPTAGPADQPS